MKRGDIYWVSLNPTQGHEQAGFRPVVIVSPEAFNRASGVPIVLPITNGGGFAQRIGFAVVLNREDLPITGLIRCDQPRALDLQQRQGEFVATLPDDLIADMVAKTRTLFE